MPAQRRSDRRQEIVREFAALIKEEGLERASVTRLAARLETSTSLIVHYFPRKEQLVAATVDYVLLRYEEAFEERHPEIVSPLERLTRLLTLLFTEEWQGLFDSSTYYACLYLTARSEVVRERWAKMQNRFVGVASRTLEDCVAAGAIPPCDTEAVADYIVCLDSGIGDFMLAFPGDERHVRLRSLALGMLAGELGIELAERR